MPELPPEVHVVLVWERALHQAEQILMDAVARFSVRDVVRVAWTPERFAQNLTRFYGTALPSGSEKERECGLGPFLVIALVDEQPVYAHRRHTRGRMRVNKHLFEAKERYRSWAGGSHRVHATLTAREGSKDVFLLLERTAQGLLTAPAWDGTVREQSVDLVGAEGWRNLDTLVTALDVTVRVVVLDDVVPPLRLLVDDLWWAVRIAEAGADDESPDRILRIGGEPSAVHLLVPGDGSLHRRWQERLLESAVRDERGWPIPSTIDRLYLALGTVAVGGTLTMAEKRLLENTVPPRPLPTNVHEPAAAGAAVDAYIASLPTPPRRPQLLRRLARY